MTTLFKNLRPHLTSNRLIVSLSLAACFGFGVSVQAQDTLTGAFLGTVKDSLTGTPVAGAKVEIRNLETGRIVPTTTDSRGRFYQGKLPPAVYRITISKLPEYPEKSTQQLLKITRAGEVVPVPIALDPASAAPTSTNTPSSSDTEIRASINTTDASRSNSFTEDDVTTLPLGATTLVRSFDELALLLPGIAPPPQAIGNTVGPGVGPGVGTSGQFSANGLRSRANNFTVDGSDNNDEDIGVRRQGFVALTPQPIESIKEYQVISLLAPAQFGRNIGAQVNAVSKSGGSDLHGTLYGSFNSSQLNARNYFDTANGNDLMSVVAGNNQPVLLDMRQIRIRNRSGGENSFTLGKVGAVLGGPMIRDRLFYFMSAEGQMINASREENFSVPTVVQRGAFDSGATGIFKNPFTGAPTATTPSAVNAGLIFSLFPFPNHPQGIYGANTFTSVLPASGRSLELSGKLDNNFKISDREQSFTGRYNFTNDWHDLAATGGAIFSTIRPRVRAQNLSLFFNSQLSGPQAVSQVFNQVRLSYGRTQLRFDELRDTQCEDNRQLQCLIPSQFTNTQFLLNAPLIFNYTTPSALGEPNTGPILFETRANNAGRRAIEEAGGPLGQVLISGFSPVGVDVFNFPQERVNNTYQLADHATWRFRDHSVAFGFDLRRTEFNSDLPRIARPYVTFHGGPRLIFDEGKDEFLPPSATDPNPVISPVTLAALEAASGFFLTVNNERDDANINLRFYQLNFFAQDEWRLRDNLSLSFGLRYEYNTVPTESRGLIENSFRDPALGLIRCPAGTAPASCGFNPFIDGRTRIFEPDGNNYAPRVGLAYSPRLFGHDRVSVFRVGYGVFYDQILGAVISQSRNVYPAFLSLNFGGLPGRFDDLAFFNPATTTLNCCNVEGFNPVVKKGTINTLNSDTPVGRPLIDFLADNFPSALGMTLPERWLKNPTAHHYTVSYEQQLDSDLVASVAYVGTVGRHLLRSATPNLGPGATVVPTLFRALPLEEVLYMPGISARVRPPDRRVPGVGAVYIFEAAAASRYDSLQLQVRGRVRTSIQYQIGYTFSSAEDDVSDVFDLGGAFALPQNSLTFEGERGPANFDARHRFVYHSIFDFSSYRRSNRTFNWILEGLQISGTGRLQTGQPFTVNSTLDVNLDGNVTDRLNSTHGIIQTGDRSQPLRLTVDNPLELLAPFGTDGRVGRNSFRAGGLVELDLAVMKQIRFASQSIDLRVDFFNLINRANFGVPVRLLEAPGFGLATNTRTPGLRVQFGLRYSF